MSIAVIRPCSPYAALYGNAAGIDIAPGDQSNVKMERQEGRQERGEQERQGGKQELANGAKCGCVECGQPIRGTERRWFCPVCKIFLCNPCYRRIGHPHSCYNNRLVSGKLHDVKPAKEAILRGLQGFALDGPSTLELTVRLLQPCVVQELTNIFRKHRQNLERARARITHKMVRGLLLPGSVVLDQKSVQQPAQGGVLVGNSMHGNTDLEGLRQGMIVEEGDETLEEGGDGVDGAPRVHFPLSDQDMEDTLAYCFQNARQHALGQSTASGTLGAVQTLLDSEEMSLDADMVMDVLFGENITTTTQTQTTAPTAPTAATWSASVAVVPPNPSERPSPTPTAQPPSAPSMVTMENKRPIKIALPPLPDSLQRPTHPSRREKWVRVAMASRPGPQPPRSSVSSAGTEPQPPAQTQQTVPPSGPHSGPPTPSPGGPPPPWDPGHAPPQRPRAPRGPSPRAAMPPSPQAQQAGPPRLMEKPKAPPSPSSAGLSTHYPPKFTYTQPTPADAKPPGGDPSYMQPVYRPIWPPPGARGPPRQSQPDPTRPVNPPSRPEIVVGGAPERKGSLMVQAEEFDYRWRSSSQPPPAAPTAQRQRRPRMAAPPPPPHVADYPHARKGDGQGRQALRGEDGDMGEYREMGAARGMGGGPVLEQGKKRMLDSMGDYGDQRADGPAEKRRRWGYDGHEEQPMEQAQRRLQPAAEAILPGSPRKSPNPAQYPMDRGDSMARPDQRVDYRAGTSPTQPQRPDYRNVGQHHGPPVQRASLVPPAEHRGSQQLDPRTDSRLDPRADQRVDPRPVADPRNDPRSDPRADIRADLRGDPRADSWGDPRADPRAVPYGSGQRPSAFAGPVPRYGDSERASDMGHPMDRPAVRHPADRWPPGSAPPRMPPPGVAARPRYATPPPPTSMDYGMREKRIPGPGGDPSERLRRGSLGEYGGAGEGVKIESVKTRGEAKGKELLDEAEKQRLLLVHQKGVEAMRRTTYGPRHQHLMDRMAAADRQQDRLDPQHQPRDAHSPRPAQPMHQPWDQQPARMPSGPYRDPDMPGGPREGMAGYWAGGQEGPARGPVQGYGMGRDYGYMDREKQPQARSPYPDRMQDPMAQPYPQRMQQMDRLGVQTGQKQPARPDYDSFDARGAMVDRKDLGPDRTRFGYGPSPQRPAGAMETGRAENGQLYGYGQDRLGAAPGMYRAQEGDPRQPPKLAAAHTLYRPWSAAE